MSALLAPPAEAGGQIDFLLPMCPSGPATKWTNAFEMHSIGAKEASDWDTLTKKKGGRN